MISFKLTSSEINEALKNIKNYEGAIRQKVQAEITKAAFRIEKKAKLAVPVDSGRLRASIAVDIVSFGATVGTNVKYAPYVEFGTVKQKAQPYLFPAAEEERQRFLDNLKKILSTK